MTPFGTIETGKRLVILRQEVHLVEKGQGTVQGMMKPTGDFVGVKRVKDYEDIKEKGGEHEFFRFFEGFLQKFKKISKFVIRQEF